MDFVEIDQFEATHLALPWPWVSIDARRARFAFAASATRIATRALVGGLIEAGPHFDLPQDLAIPGATQGPGARGTVGFAIAPSGDELALVGNTEGGSILCTLTTNGNERRSPLNTLAGAECTARAVAFDAAGARLWVSADSPQATLLLLVETATHQVLGKLESPTLPEPGPHELHVHPVDNAVLLLAACGPHGTFARVAGWSDGAPEAISTSMDTGSVPAGFVRFSADSARVHFAEADELRTHAWPGLQELSSVEFPGSFASSYAGVVLGKRIYVDGEDRDDEGQDAVMLFDPSGILGARLRAPVPTGMWVGKLGNDCIVTIDAAGEPARGRVLRIPALLS
jgi:hypothetical protein